MAAFNLKKTVAAKSEQEHKPEHGHKSEHGHKPEPARKDAKLEHGRKSDHEAERDEEEEERAPGKKVKAKKVKGTTTSGEKPARRGKRRSRSFAMMLLVPLVGLGGLVAGGPWLLAHSGMLDQVVSRFLSGAGTVHVGSAGLSWNSPVTLGDIQLRDSQGELLAEVASVTTDKNLLALLMNRSDLGRIEITGPTLHLILREGTSNLEDMLAKFSESQGSGAMPAAELALSDGKVTIDDTLSKRQFAFEKLTLDLKLLGSAEKPLEASGSADLIGAQAGGLKFELHSGPQGEGGGSPLAAAHLTANLNALPLSVAQSWLRRVLPEAEINGQVTANVDYGWGQGAGHNERSLQGEMAVTNLDLAAAALGADRFQLASLRVPCQVTQAGATLKIQQLAIESDIGQMAASGQARLDDLSRPDMMKTLAHETFQLSGQLDLAQLARLLPNTLRIRQGTPNHGRPTDLSRCQRTGRRRRQMASASARQQLGRYRSRSADLVASTAGDRHRGSRWAARSDH